MSKVQKRKVEIALNSEEEDTVGYTTFMQKFGFHNKQKNILKKTQLKCPEKRKVETALNSFMIESEEDTMVFK